MVIATNIPEFCQGITYFPEALPGFNEYGKKPAIALGENAISSFDERSAVYQTMLAADALRYLTLLITASKVSGHPGGFASIAEVIAALVMLGHKNIITEVGHHAPGFYSSMFLDRSLEDMGIRTVKQLTERYRERHGLIGHVSGQIPGILNPAGPLGQGQHFALAGAKLYRDRLFPVTIGDGGLDEPYIMSSFIHFHAAYPNITNFLPILVWNGYCQEHHSMVSVKTNQQMTEYWKGNGFQEVILVDAKEYDDANQSGNYVDSTKFSLSKRLEFTQAVLEATNKAEKSAISGQLTVLIVKQLKGAGIHARGIKSHTLYANDTLDCPEVIDALGSRALTAEAWQLVRTNFERAGGGSASRQVVTEKELSLVDLEKLSLEEFSIESEPKVPTTAMGKLIAYVGQKDSSFVISNADTNDSVGLNNVNAALKIIHPTIDETCYQNPNGQVYEPLNEDACAGLAASLSLMGSRALWCSCEAFAINGLPIWQTVTQSMAELRRSTPSAIALFTAGALEQSRNGWTHQRPEVENYLAAMIRNGNIFPLFPCDANSIQTCYEWALTTKNKGITITASRTALPILTTCEQTRQGLQDGGVVLYESKGKKKVVFAVIGDLTLIPVFDAAKQLEKENIGVRIVSIISPRRLYRPEDVAWETCRERDGHFLDEQGFAKLFDGDSLIGITSGASGMLEPVMLRSHLKRDIFAWKRGDTVASFAQLIEFNRLNAENIAKRAIALIK
jgi:phosphoketolase